MSIVKRSTRVRRVMTGQGGRIDDLFPPCEVQSRGLVVEA